MKDTTRDHSWMEVSRRPMPIPFTSKTWKQVEYRCLRCEQEVSYTWAEKVGKLPKKTLTDSYPNLMPCDEAVAAKVMEG